MGMMEVFLQVDRFPRAGLEPVALLSAVQIPGGVPIASVGVDGAKNAGLLAASIASVGDEALAGRMANARETQRAGVEKADARVQEKISSRD